jgi:hypothetical protein
MNPKNISFRKYLYLLCSLILCSKASSQNWIGNDSFDGAVLDSSKWSTSEEVAYDGEENFAKLSGVLSFQSSSSLPRVGYVKWKQALPTNEAWTVYVRTLFKPTYFTGNRSAQFVEAVLSVFPSGQDPSQKYFSVGEGITWSVNSNATYIGSECAGASSGNGYYSNWISNNDMYLKIVYDPQSKSMKAFYTADTGSGGPSNSDTWFQTIKTADVSGWNATSFEIAIGGYSEGIAVAAGIINLDNFVVVPRPVLQMSSVPSPFFTGIETWAFLRFMSHPQLPVYLEYRPKLSEGSWISAGAVFPDSTGSISVTLKALGDKVTEWKQGLFFRVKNP